MSLCVYVCMYVCMYVIVGSWVGCSRPSQKMDSRLGWYMHAPA